MKKYLLGAFVGLFAFIILGFGARAHAFSAFRSGNNATVATSETINSTLFTGGRDVVISGNVNGDVFCGGSTINISGTITGDVICAGQTINITGKVDGNVRLVGQTITLNGVITRNATVAGQTITLDSKAKIGQDAHIAGSTFNLNGTIGRDLLTGATNVNVAGTVGRDIKGNMDTLYLGGTSKVKGGVDYTSTNQIIRAPGAVVKNAITRHIPTERQRSFPRLALFTRVAALIFALVLLLTAVILTALMPRVVSSVSEHGISKPWMAMLTGFVASLVVPIFSILLFITVVGIPLAFLMMMAWMLIVVSSGLFTAYYVGRRVWNEQKNHVLTVLVGGFILLVLTMLPLLGLLVIMASFWFGSGMVLMELNRIRLFPKKPTSKKKVATT